ncbi:hypothetical protein ACFPOU_16475 [Massilia jejuensis]|uniref:Uncharacterized protein n=1 Tax=Massilia jejuensis TaxID=648894 RepID=A0ABW0PQG2_9BURK
MSATTMHPPKHLVREYLARRSRDPQPPPTPEEIRRQLGWGIVDAEVCETAHHPAAAAAFG